MLCLRIARPTRRSPQLSGDKCAKCCISQLGLHYKHHRRRDLFYRQQRVILSQFWRLEVWDQSGGLVGFWSELSSWLVDDHLLAMSSYGWQRQNLISLPFLMRVLIPSWRLCHHELIQPLVTFQRLHFQLPSWGQAQLQHMNLEVYTCIQSITNGIFIVTKPFFLTLEGASHPLCSQTLWPTCSPSLLLSGLHISLTLLVKVSLDYQLD
jgi:hypothetical protein